MAGYTLRATTIIPEDVVEIPEGQTVAKGVTVDLPDAYGDHLVADGLAAKASKAKPSKDGAAPAQKAPAAKPSKDEGGKANGS